MSVLLLNLNLIFNNICWCTELYIGLNLLSSNFSEKTHFSNKTNLVIIKKEFGKKL